MKHLVLGAVFCLLGAAGCAVRVDPVVPPPAVVVSPGWYYDPEYVDAYGVFHPRVIWFYGDHGWERRDAAPPGVVFHDRTPFFHADRGPHGEFRGYHRDR
jgi:hypothetical protein